MQSTGTKISQRQSMTESQVLGVVADLVLQEMNGGVNVAESFTSTTRRLTGEVAEDLIVDRTM
jgi:hypothetical protein